MRRVLFALLLLPFTVLAEPLAVGQPLPALSFEDQFEEKHQLGPDTRLVIFSSGMAPGKLAHEVMKDYTGEQLAAAGVVSISDISGMPGFVTRMFAMPKFRDYGYPLLLGREEDDTAVFPQQEGKVTILRIEDGRVAEVRFIDQAQELKAAVADGL